MGLTQRMLLAEFNALPDTRAREQLMACCAAPDWAAAVTAGRPYRDLAALHQAAEVTLSALDWSQIEKALGDHPRIGATVAGESQQARWSSREQAGVASANEAALDALARANRAYEQRFGHIFLIFASGRSVEQILEAAEQRLRNDEATERGIVRRELAAIVGLRLHRLVDQ